MARRFELTVLGLYALFVSIVAARHEPWNDETQAWRLAIDSHGVADLVHNARYEGHPLLWHLMLQALGHLSRSWWPVVVVHVVIACVGAWLVLRYAPFTRLQKVLIVFGYWSAYEYAVVARPYGLGMMLGFAACVAWLAPRRRIVWVIACLVLLANTTAMGTMLAMALAAAFVFDWLWPDDEARRPRRRARVAACIAVAALALPVLLVAMSQIRPPADAAFQGTTPTSLSRWIIASIPTVELRALLPLVSWRDAVEWNQWLLKPDTTYMLALLLLLSAVYLVIGLMIAARRRVALVFFVLGTGGFLIFFGFLFDGVARHHGYLFVVWIIAAWLACSGAPSGRPAMLRRFNGGAEPARGNLLVLSLLVPVLATIELATADILTPFSDARHVADVIRAAGLRDQPIVAVSPSDAQSVSAFSDRPVFFPLDGQWRTFVVWGSERSYPRMARAADSATTALLATHCHVVLIASAKYEVASETAARARTLYTTSFEPMSGARYRVWVATAPDSARCPAARNPALPERSAQPVTRSRA
jgi:hypothetical protein